MAVTWLMIMLPLGALALLFSGILATVFKFMLLLTWVVALRMGLKGMSLARRGRLLRYRFNLRLIK